MVCIPGQGRWPDRAPGTGHEAASQPKQEPAAGLTAPGTRYATATPNRRGPGQARCTCCLHTSPHEHRRPEKQLDPSEQVAGQGVTRVALSTMRPSHNQGGDHRRSLGVWSDRDLVSEFVRLTE